MSRTLPPRLWLSRLATIVLFVSTAGLFGLAAHPRGEDEEPKPRPFKKIAVDDDDVKPLGPRKTPGEDTGVGKQPALPGSAPDVRLDELVRAAQQTDSPILKALFQKYSIPFDKLTETTGSTRIKPIPFRKSEWPAGQNAVSVTPLDSAGKPREARPAQVANVRAVDHFEALLLADADSLVKQKSDEFSRTEQLAAAEKLLSAAIRFHDFAREGNLRRGKGWEEVRTALRDKQREVRLELLRAYIAANDRARVREWSSRLMTAYPGDAAVAGVVAAAQVGEAERLLGTGSDQDAQEAKKLLNELEKNFPGAGGENARKLRARLKEIAQKALTRAREKLAVGDERTARDELTRAMAIDDTLDGILELQRKLQPDYSILNVGVRHFPERMSPATARLDSEKQAVELICEGLLEEIPDRSGAVQYRDGASFGMPSPVYGARDFLLRAFDRDAAGRPGFDSHDVVGTVKLLRTRPDTWVGYPLIWLATELPPPRDSGSVRIPFGLGHPDPRAALTFKLLPTRWLSENSRTIDDDRFARNPIQFNTGPFKYHGTPPPKDGEPRHVVFIANPTYNRWPDRATLPALKEVHLVDVAGLDPVKAFKDRTLHILTDVPTSSLDDFTDAKSGLQGTVAVIKAAVNRRLHMLAVNLRRPYFQNKALRQGISLAIDREEILNKVYRAGKLDYHKALTGPFPPGSWSAGKGLAPSLMNSDLAVARLKTYLADAGAKATIDLAYPDGDPQAEKACRMIKANVEGLFKAEPPGSRRLTIDLVKVNRTQLDVQVQDQHSFDLAYVPFDYPDDWYPLGLAAALDPQATGRGGRNWFGFLEQQTNPDQGDQDLGHALNRIRGYRDFGGELVPQAATITRLFNDSLPFIPLWQLDRHMVISNRVKLIVDESNDPIDASFLNQTTLFQGVARWQLK
jgi:hypothetical protein